MSNIRRADGRQPLIEVNAEHRLVMLDRADGWRFTDQHQRLFYPATPLDTGFKEMPKTATTEILWGGFRVIAGGGGGGREPRYPQRP